MAVTAKKKTPGTSVFIAQWCLDVFISAPSAEEVAAMRVRLLTNHDDARLPDVHTHAAFALMARVPGTGARYFSDLDLRLLSHRDVSIQRAELEKEPEIFAEVVAALCEKPTATKSTKTPVKKVK